MIILALSIIIFLFMLWIFSLFTCIEDTFKKQHIKAYWLIGHIVCPLTALAYLIFRNKYTISS